MPHRVQEQIALLDSMLGDALLCGSFKIGRDSLFEVDVDNGGQEFVHALLVRNVGVDLAPNEEHVGEQFEYLGVLEEGHLLVGTVHVFLDLFVQETVGLLTYRRSYYLFLLRLGHHFH